MADPATTQGATMKLHLEEDFKNLQALLFALTDPRRGVAKGSSAAIKIDKEIEVCQDLYPVIPIAQRVRATDLGVCFTLGGPPFYSEISFQL